MRTVLNSGQVPPRVLGVIACGGALGALARYGLGAAFPHGPGDLPWDTLWINVSGCLLIGVLMVLVADARHLLRPFLGVGVLGGYTTFSTYVVDVQRLVSAGRLPVAAAYLLGTLLAALAAAHLGMVAARAALALVGRDDP